MLRTVKNRLQSTNFSSTTRIDLLTRFMAPSAVPIVSSCKLSFYIRILKIWLIPFGLISFEDRFKAMITCESQIALTIAIAPESPSKFLSRFKCVIRRLGCSNSISANAVANLMPSFIFMKISLPLIFRLAQCSLKRVNWSSVSGKARSVNFALKSVVTSSWGRVCSFSSRFKLKINNVIRKVIRISATYSTVVLCAFICLCSK